MHVGSRLKILFQMAVPAVLAVFYVGACTSALSGRAKVIHVPPPSSPEWACAVVDGGDAVCRPVSRPARAARIQTGWRLDFVNGTPAMVPEFADEDGGSP